MTETPHGIDEGYVKYDCDWSQGPPPDTEIVDELNRWRAPLFAAGMIGYDSQHDVGFGNMSIRAPGDFGFVISGTQTGHVEATTGAHYTLVTNVDVMRNRVRCTGPVAASSEAMTHAALYALDDSVGAVVHVHSAALWKRYLDRLPTTNRGVTYGTPQMAHEFARLWHDTEFRENGVAVMAGHNDGLLSIGVSLEIAAERMLGLS